MYALQFCVRPALILRVLYVLFNTILVFGVPEVSGSSSSAANFGYGCVIDAGSSGSRIYVYRWPARKFDTLPPSVTQVEREALFSEKKSPGISDQVKGLPLLNDLISLAKAAIPEDADLKRIPVYLGATAGMRILDPTLEAEIMTKVRAVLHSSGFLFHDDWARTISGEEEGSFGWLVANYLMNKNEMPEVDGKTYGALDLGGASTQISFKPKGSVLANQFPLTIDETEYLLYTHSFLYYGVDQAAIQFDTKHLSTTMKNPCYPTGYTNSKTNVSGSSSWDDCLSQVAALFDTTQPCFNSDGKPERCSFNGVYQPPMGDKKFIAMSAFVYAWQYLGLSIGSKTDDLVKLSARAKTVCDLTYTQQLQNMPAGTRNSSVGVLCFNAAYSYQLLHKGYGMPTSNTPIEIYDKIGGTQVQWAFGMMIVEANKLGWIFEGSSTYKYLFTILTPVFVVLSCALAYLLYQAKRSGVEGSYTQESYVPLSGNTLAVAKSNERAKKVEQTVFDNI